MKVKITKRATKYEVGVSLNMREFSHLFGPDALAEFDEDKPPNIGFSGSGSEGVLFWPELVRSKKNRMVKKLVRTRGGNYGAAGGPDQLVAEIWLPTRELGIVYDHRPDMDIRGIEKPGHEIAMPPLRHNWLEPGSTAKVVRPDRVQTATKWTPADIPGADEPAPPANGHEPPAEEAPPPPPSPPGQPPIEYVRPGVSGLPRPLPRRLPEDPNREDMREVTEEAERRRASDQVYGGINADRMARLVAAGVYITPSRPGATTPMMIDEVRQQQEAFGELLDLAAQLNTVMAKAGEVKFLVENNRLLVMQVYRPGQVSLRSDKLEKRN